MSGDASDFNNMKTRAVIKFFFPSRQGAEGNSRHSDRNIKGTCTNGMIFMRRGADKSLARLTSRCRRTESIVSSERWVCSCAELQVFCCYRGWKEACQATRGISTTWRRELSSSFIFKLPVRTATCIYLTFPDCNKFFCELNYRITLASVLPRPGCK